MALRQRRRQLGMTQDALAQKSDLTLRFIQELEAGNKQPTLTTLFKLSAGLEISPDELIQPIWEKWEQED